ncbi:DUF5694 domain-containing protein [Myroides fluvii]|uniref:DUF5694 domain-containing protein n=1 Tax=Myroides fluvii TaxID=2572594 RepID=UPI00131B1AA2|nr:DUF5694 domain-containing protein [Myroides fluvii]
MKKILLFLLCISPILAFSQQKNKILLVGTFHFHLVTSQFGVEFDLNKKQTELDEIADQIAAYKPTKIFVEWEYTKQKELNELFNLYLKDNSLELVRQKYGKNETMYTESEIQQLGFRIANKLNHKKLYAFDYLIPEPNDTIMNAIQQYNQIDLMQEIQQDFGEYGQKIINTFQTTTSIKDLLFFFNSKELEQQLNTGYISLFNKVGSIDDFSGAYFVSERYKRNLYMYSLIQKQLEKTDERILVLVGAQHAAGFSEFISNDKNIENVELKTLVK